MREAQGGLGRPRLEVKMGRATKLEKPLTRETELEHNGFPILAVLDPGNGGQLILRPKGLRAVSWAVSFRKLLAHASKAAPRAAQAPKVSGGREAAEKADLISMGEFEAMLMSDGELDAKTKGRIFEIVRQARDRRREAVGLERVGYEPWEKRR